jgi:hypothetical protein
MRRISGLVLAASLLLPVSLARAAEVTHLYTNNQFANATSFDPVTGASTGIFVTREKGKGAPRDSIFIIISGPDGFSLISGTLPKNALKMNAQSASLDVDVADIVPDSEFNFPDQGIVSVHWQATDITRESGNTKMVFGNTTVLFVGTSTSSPATISGSLFGDPLPAMTGDLSRAHTSVTIHVSQ